MDSDRELRTGGTDPGCDLKLVNAGLQNGLNVPISPHSSGAFSLSNRGNHHHYHDLQTDNCSHLSHQHPKPLNMPEASTRYTSSTGPSPLSEARASGSDPSKTPPIGTTKPSHRTPYQHLPSHLDLLSSHLRRSSSADQLKKLGGGPPFSPPFLHPLSHRTKLQRARSPFSVSAQRSKGSEKPRSRFTISSSPPNSPIESEPNHVFYPPKPFSSPLTARGFLALSTFSKVIALLFACCVLLLLRAFFGIGHSAESCGVYAHEVTEPSLRSGFPSESSGSGLGATDLKLPTNHDTSVDQNHDDELGEVWLEMIDGMYGYQYDWKLEEHDIEHGDDGSDSYDDEYEDDDFLDQTS